VLLANLAVEQRVKLISEMGMGTPPALATTGTPKTILTAERLQAELDRVRDDGFAVNDEETAAGTCAIAAPVRDDSGDVVAAVSVVAQNGVIELDELVHRFEGQLMATAERISARMGYVE